MKVEYLKVPTPFVQMLNPNVENKIIIIIIINGVIQYFSISCWCRDISSSVVISRLLCSDLLLMSSSVTEEKYITKFEVELTSGHNVCNYEKQDTMVLKGLKIVSLIFNFAAEKRWSLNVRLN